MPMRLVIGLLLVEGHIASSWRGRRRMHGCAGLFRERWRERYHSNRVVADSYFAVTSVLSTAPPGRK
jgi:hypothetical protein